MAAARRGIPPRRLPGTLSINAPGVVLFSRGFSAFSGLQHPGCYGAGTAWGKYRRYNTVKQSTKTGRQKNSRQVLILPAAVIRIFPENQSFSAFSGTVSRREQHETRRRLFPSAIRRQESCDRAGRESDYPKLQARRESRLTVSGHRGGKQMRNVKIGAPGFILMQEVALDMPGTLKRVADLGYDGFEMLGFFWPFRRRNQPLVSGGRPSAIWLFCTAG